MTRRLLDPRRGVAVALLLIGAAGCTQHRASGLATPSIEPPFRVPKDTMLVERHRVTIWSLAWGNVRSGPSQVECDGAGLAEVTFSSPPHYTLLTILTLGGVSPKVMRVKCAKITPSGGEFEDPDSTGARAPIPAPVEE
jgi:hypothetical protein